MPRPRSPWVPIWRQQCWVAENIGSRHFYYILDVLCTLYTLYNALATEYIVSAPSGGEPSLRPNTWKSAPPQNQYFPLCSQEKALFSKYVNR